MERPIEIFFSYAHENDDLTNDVRRQLIAYAKRAMVPTGAAKSTNGLTRRKWCCYS